MWPFGRKRGQSENTAPDGQKTKTLSLPDDHFATLQWSFTGEGRPINNQIIVLINTPYIGFEHRDVFQWVLQLEVSVRKEEGGGLPSSAEADVLNDMEDAILDAISPKDQKPNAVFVLRETDRDLRTIFFAVYDPEVANSALQMMLEGKHFDLPWQFRMEADQDWKSLDFYFKKYIEAVQGGYLH
jgi:Family of unknown function (DUF695)